MKFHTVVIIYNPNSTGPSKHNAESLKEDLLERGFDGDIQLVGTKFAGHAEEITAQHASNESTLILSSSGDGGYNEVVNGYIQSGAAATIAVLPSGNANDHAVTVGTDDFISSILTGNMRRIDCISVESTVEGKPWKRYAHSYAGFGMTPSVGKLLTYKRPGVLLEKWYVLKHVLSFHHVTLIIDGRRRKFTNLIAAIIPKMSKVVKLDEDASVTDGNMEIYITKYVSRLKVILTLIGIGLSGVASESRTKSYTVRTVRPILIQLDGEVTRIDADADITMRCESDRIQTLA